VLTQKNPNAFLFITEFIVAQTWFQTRTHCRDHEFKTIQVQKGLWIRNKPDTFWHYGYMLC